MEEKRLLVLVSAFTRGGAQKVLLNLIPEWITLGLKVRIVLIQNSQNELDLNLLHQLGVQIDRLESKSAYDVRSFVRYLKILRNFSPNVIQCHLFLAQIWGTLFKLFNRKAHVVWVEHNMYMCRTKFEWRFFRLFSRFTHEIVAVSVEVMEYLRQKRIKNIRFIPNPISQDFSLNNSNKRDANIVFVGRFTDQKNPMLALGAFEYALNNGLIPPLSKLFMVGAGPLLDDLENYVMRHELDSKVDFPGFLNSSQLSELLNKCSVLLSTSKYEGCPLVRSEAIASGCCIVTTQTGGIKGILTEDWEGNLLLPGVFVTPASYYEISQALHHSFSDQYWDKSAIDFRSSVAITSSPKVIAMRYLESEL